MNKNIIKVAGLALAAAFALSARADVAIHQNVSVYGYAAGSVQYSKPDKGNSDTEMDLDAAKIGLAFNFAPVTAKISVYADQGADEINILEANATYDIGNGFSLTGGRFQSWIGYEAFDIPNCNFITYGTDVIGAIIPNFHEGIRFDYALEKMSFGVAVVDSVYNRKDEYRGDGRLSDGYGVEGHFGYNDGALSLGATLAYQNTRFGATEATRAPAYNVPLMSDTYIADVWAQYVLNQTTFGAELYYAYTRENSNDNDKIFYGLVMVKQQFNEKFSLAGRVSAGRVKDKAADAKGEFWKVSAMPAYALTQNLSFGLEVSYTQYYKELKRGMGAMSLENNGKNKVYAGVQAVFKF